QALLDDARVLGAQLAVERDGAARAMARHHLHQPEDADAIAVVARRPDGNVWRLAAAAGRRGDLLVEREELDVGDDPDRDPRAVRPLAFGPVDHGGIGKRTVAARLHCAASRMVRPSRVRTIALVFITSAYLWWRSKRLTLWEMSLRSKQHSSAMTMW